MKSILIILFCTQVSSALASEVDCSEAYGGSSARCEQVACDEKYLSFIGTWSGLFQSYVRELSTKDNSVYRPFENTVSYSKSDCLKNLSTGDTFIIGRRTDKYSAFQNLKEELKTGLLITGRKLDGTPFLKTIDKENGVTEYQLDYQNKAASLSIWSATYPATEQSPEMKFTTIDAQDFSKPAVHSRNVTVTMSIRSKEQLIWEGVVVSGSHSLHPPR